MAWYREWFGEEYLELYAHRDREEADVHARFVVERLPAVAHGRVLDLACGMGRHLEGLRRLAPRSRAIGVDLSRTLLARSTARGCLAAADMRRLPFAAACFDVVLNFFTSFGYFERERENFEVLEEIARVLAPGGRVLMDLMNAELAIARLEPSESTEIQGQPVAVERWYDRGERRINKRITIGPGRERVFRESVRAYSRDEVTIGMRWAGLEVVEELGDFAGRPFDPGSSPRLLLIAERAP